MPQKIKEKIIECPNCHRKWEVEEGYLEIEGAKECSYCGTTAEISINQSKEKIETVKLKFAPGVYPHQLQVDHGDVSLTKQLKQLINAVRPIEDEKTKDSRLIQGILIIIRENKSNEKK